jgi:hypothetical protein
MTEIRPETWHMGIDCFSIGKCHLKLIFHTGGSGTFVEVNFQKLAKGIRH